VSTLIRRPDQRRDRHRDTEVALRLIEETPGLGEARLKRIIGNGEATYLRRLRVVRRPTRHALVRSLLATPAVTV
jgi:hypothetical protein